MKPSIDQAPSSTTIQKTVSGDTAEFDGFCSRMSKPVDVTLLIRVTTGIELLTYCTVLTTTGEK